MDFFVVSNSFKDFASIQQHNNTKIREVCELCGGIIIRYVKPIKFSIKGKNLADINYDLVPYKIISKKLQDVLTFHQLKGFELMEVEVTIHDALPGKEDSLKELKELIVNGRVGKLRNKDGIELANCPQCHRVSANVKDDVTGLHVDPKEWDGSDLFYFSNWEGNLIVTERVKGIMESAEITNVEFTNVKSFVFNKLLKEMNQHNEK